MGPPLVVGVDGSDGSFLAVDWAVDEAARHGLPLRLVHASLWERYEDALRSGQVRADALVATAADRATRRNREVRVTTDVVPEDPATALLREGDNASLVVTGSRGRGELAGLLLGSVGLAVAARAPCPVVVVRGDRAGLAGLHDRILLGAGEPASTGEAVRFAIREVRARDCVLDVVRAWRRPAHEIADPRSAGDPARTHQERATTLLSELLDDTVADHPDVRVRRATPEGPARKVLLHRTAAADLVIVGAGRRTGHVGLQLGRVAHTLLHHADCPVAIVPERV